MLHMVTSIGIIYLLPLGFFLYYIFNYVVSYAAKNQPPSPPKLPVFGHLFHLGSLPHRSLHSLSQNYGPLMLLHFGRAPVLVVSSPDAARQVMKTHDLVFSDRPKFSVAHRLLYGSRNISFSKYNEHWRQMKGLFVIHMLSTKRVSSFRSIREEETSLMISKLLSSSSSASINLTESLTVLTNDIMCRVSFGRKYTDGDDWRRFHVLLMDSIELLARFNVGDYIPWLAWLNRFNGLDAEVERVSQMDAFLEIIIQQRKNKKLLENEDDGCNDSIGGSTHNILDILLESQRDDTIKALIWDMFSGGTDTTSATLDWAMAELMRNPRAMKKLQEEVRQVAHGKEDISEDDLPRMEYLKAVIREALRLHPPIPLLVPHFSNQDANVMGYDIKSGTQVLINAWAIHRDPSAYDDAGEFRPERHPSSVLMNVMNENSFDYIPFSKGRRKCPGVNFSQPIVELALAKLVHRFDFSLSGGLTAENLDMTEDSGVTMHRKLPLIVDVTEWECA